MERYDHGGDVYSRPVELDFSVNLNPLGMPPAVRQALIDSVDSYSAYPDPKCRRLCAALAQGCSPDQVLCGNGAADLIIRLCLARKPKRVLVCAPTFSEYEKAALLCGAAVELYPLEAQRNFDLDEGILSRLGQADMVFLCNPNNPTGRLIDPALLRDIGQRCRQLGTLLVIDQCFLSFTTGQSMKSAAMDNPNIVILEAFTKLYAMAGLRLGYMICSDEALLKSVAHCGQSWSVSAPAQIAGLAALNCGDRWISRTRQAVRCERDFMTRELEQLALRVCPSEANYMTFQSPKPLMEPLLQRRILIRSCANYSGLDGSYYRIGLKLRRDNSRLIQALAEVMAQD